MRSLALSLAGLLVGVSVARAQDFEAAAKHFSSAQAAFNEQHFKIAAEEFQSAYEATKDPILLYNIGEAWQKAGEGKKSVASYKAYLKAQRKAKDRTEVQKRIKMIVAKKYKIPDLSVKIAVAEAPVAPPPPPTPPPPSKEPGDQPMAMAPDTPLPSAKDQLMPLPDEPPPPKKEPPAPPPATVAAPAEAPPPGLIEEAPASKMRIAAWVGVATTVAVLTAGAIFGLAAQSRADEISRRLTFVDANGQPRKFDQMAQDDVNSLASEGHLYNNLAIGFFAGAGACAVVTAVLFGVDARHTTKHAKLRVTPSFAKNGAGLVAGWSF
jgi:hypothetical protein